jgi:predicted nucleic acid-binding protein
MTLAIVTNRQRQLLYSNLPSWSVLERTERLLGAYSLSLWDAMIIAACLGAGVTRLFSEDLDVYPRVDGLEIVNPFGVSDAARSELAGFSLLSCVCRLETVEANLG